MMNTVELLAISKVMWLFLAFPILVEIFAKEKNQNYHQP